MVSEVALPPRLREFLATMIRSVEEIDLLLYLHKERGAHTSLQLADAMHLPEATTITALQNLVLCRLVVQQGDSSPLRYELAAARAELREAVDELARVYDDCRLDILLLISSKALERVRSGARRAFSDPRWSADPKKRR